jgi:hypothetical protein
MFSTRTFRNCEGAVLLEVVLALLLFVAAVAVVSSALSASMDSVQRQRSAMHAANLAATVHAEIDMGLRGTDSGGPEPFPKPFEGWTWQLAQSSAENEAGEASGLADVEIIVRNTNSPTVFRLAQLHKVQKEIVRPATTGATP